MILVGCNQQLSWGPILSSQKVQINLGNNEENEKESAGTDAMPSKIRSWAKVSAHTSAHSPGHLAVSLVASFRSQVQERS
jgi:hypothetical protein